MVSGAARRGYLPVTEEKQAGSNPAGTASNFLYSFLRYIVKRNCTMARDNNKYHYIYKTTCKVTGRFYYGMHSTNNLEDGYIGSGTRLWFSIRKHGRENHELEILEHFPDRSSLKEREREIVNETTLKDPQCLNLTIGGNGGFSLNASKKGGAVHKQKMEFDTEYREKVKKIVSENVLKLHQNGKIKVPDWTGRKHRPETIEKFRKRNFQEGEKNSQFGTVWIFDPVKNRAAKISSAELERKIQEGCRRGRKQVEAVI